MNIGTRLRGIALILALVLTGFALFNGMMFVAKVAIFVALIVAAGVGYYYNEDFSEAGCQGTGVTREMKAEKDELYVGDFFYTEEEDEEDVSDEQYAI